MKRSDETNTAGSSLNWPSYTAQDIEAFEKLRPFPATQSRAATGNAKKLQYEHDATKSTIYSYADIEEFEKLAPGNVAHTQENVQAFDRFDSMMTTPTASATRVSPNLVEQPETENIDSNAYSAQDLDVFARLMPVPERERSVPASPLQPHATGNTTDVGYIKIVEFDNENANAQRARENAHIKVRFFD